MTCHADARYTGLIRSAWLNKAKGDGAKARWLMSSCKRYFTIDFDSQIVFYSHIPGDKRVSCPIHFRDILSATSAADLPDETLAGNGNQWALRRSSSGSIARAKKPQTPTEFPFFLQTRERRIQLSAESDTDRVTWVDMLNAAHRFGACTNSQSEPESPSGLSAWQNDSIPGNTSPCSTAEGSESSDVVSSAAWSDADLISCEASSSVASAAEVSAKEAAPALVEAPCMDSSRLSAQQRPEPAASPACAPSAANTGSEAAANAMTAPRRLTERRPNTSFLAETSSSSSGSPLRKTFQATDFGFDEELASDREIHASERDSSPDSVTISPRPVRPGGILGIVGGCPLDEQRQDGKVVVRSDEAYVLDSDDDDSDEEAASHQVGDRRIELDLELVKAQQQRQARLAKSSTSPPGNQAERSEEGVIIVESDGEDSELEGPAQREARMAVDLALLRTTGGASSAVTAAVAGAAAPLRQRAHIGSEKEVDDLRATRKADKDREGGAASSGTKAEAEGDEEKARRRAARRAARQAAAEAPLQENVIAETEEDKARRRAARKAAKMASEEMLVQEQGAVETEEQRAQRRAARKAAKAASMQRPAELNAELLAEETEEEKARRRAARKAEKEAAKEAAMAEQTADEEKARRKAARKAAKAAALDDLVAEDAKR